MTVQPLTPAERRALAELNLTALGALTAGTTAYNGRAQAAIANSLIEISAYLQALVAILEPAPEPEVPGLPTGWHLTADRAKDGNQLWGYKLTPPDGSPEITNRHRWSTWGGAMDAGLDAAATIAAAAADPARRLPHLAKREDMTVPGAGSRPVRRQNRRPGSITSCGTSWSDSPGSSPCSSCWPACTGSGPGPPRPAVCVPAPATLTPTATTG